MGCDEMRSFFAAVLLFALAGCAASGMRVVNTVDSTGFQEMSRAMQEAMHARKIVDEDGRWMQRMFAFGPFDAGNTMLDRLSPSFRFPDAGMKLPATLRASLGEDAVVRTHGPSAVAEQGLFRMELDLLALTDWNGDGDDDWLISCRIFKSKKSRDFREYYLAVTDPKRPVWEAETLMILDHAGGRVRQVRRASEGVLAESSAMDYEQGQAQVVRDPEASRDSYMEKHGHARKTSLKN